MEDQSLNKATVNSRFEDVRNLILTRDTFIDRIYPLRVIGMVSNALHSWVDKSHRRSLAEHESKVMKELNEAVLLTNKVLDRNDAVNAIMDDCKVVESRKMKILS